jgi:hypothetical protein
MLLAAGREGQTPWSDSSGALDRLVDKRRHRFSFPGGSTMLTSKATIK